MRLATASFEAAPEFRPGSQNRMLREIVLSWGAHLLSSRPVMRCFRCTCANLYGIGVSGISAVVGSGLARATTLRSCRELALAKTPGVVADRRSEVALDRC